MFSKDGTMYSDAFKYLYNPRMNAVAFQFAESDGWEEVSLPEDFDIQLQEDFQDGKVVGHRAFFHNRLFVATLPAELSYGAVKTAIIQKRYSNDDQIALMLNRENSEESENLYQKMQMWRDFAATFARKVMALVSE